MIHVSVSFRSEDGAAFRVGAARATQRAILTCAPTRPTRAPLYKNGETRACGARPPIDARTKKHKMANERFAPQKICNFPPTDLTIFETCGKRCCTRATFARPMLGWGGFFFVGRERYGKMPTH
ncbi:hypothetical protein GPZ74_03500 [Burkholderia pseudomallei]|nr:conserved hypothetical protein [Burkholderia pseudomallei Pakistan 9]MVZ83125.1 hypothetical protein [Burkholderia pseudomallei]MWA23587.1 hypothetical protein [Burkholderia pseudomallei]